MQRNRAHSTTHHDFAPRATVRRCDHSGCTDEGEYRAPKARNQLNEYFWFCLNHVREYNKAWDYYAGMDPDQIESEVRGDTTWQRPTWPLGFWSVQEKFLRDRVVKGFGFEFGRDDGAHEQPTPHGHAARTPEEKALAVLDLSPPVDFPRIKTRYRELVKTHHPDANGGDKQAEEKLKEINQAYNTLKACYGV